MFPVLIFLFIWNYNIIALKKKNDYIKMFIVNSLDTYKITVILKKDHI